MAKSKKAAQGLTPEEKLAQALVPVEEQPYQIPENWCWAYLDKVYCVNPKNDAEDDADAAFIPMEKISAGMQNDYTFETQPWKKAKKGHTQFADGDVAFAKISPCFENRKSMIAENLPNGIGGGTTELIVLRQPKILSKYTFWLISDENFVQGGKNTYSGTVGQQRISMDYVRNYRVPLPPLAEQQRIVDRIESIFAKLDEAKEKAQAVVDGFELRKSAILHKAFTGELTAKWREEHEIKIDGWKKYKIDECCKVGSGGTPSRKHPEYYEGSIPWIKTGEIDWNDILDAEEKISDAAVQNSSAKIYESGVILVAMYGMGVTRGKAAILRVQAATNQAVCVLQPKNDLLNRYLFYYFMYNYWNIREKSVGGNQLNLSATIIKNFDILIPSIDEQSEITRILDSLLAKENAVKDTAETVLDQIDAMKKAVLARAFRGELGTNDPTEESAVELLKTML